eukprot:gene33983-41125_t
MALLRKGTDTLCPKCNLPVKVELGESSVTPQRDSDEAQEQDQDQDQSGSDDESTGATYEELKRRYAQQRQQQDLVSQRIAKRLLQGWAMLATECEASGCRRCPLMASDGSVVCPACETQYLQHNDGVYRAVDAKDVHVSGRHSNSEGYVPPVDLSAAPTLLPQADNDVGANVDRSMQLSSLLRKGWKMLARTCPSCPQLPLMRDPAAEQDFCVACGYPAKISEQPAAAASAAPTAAAPAVPPRQRPACEPEEENVESLVRYAMNCVGQRLRSASSDVASAASITEARDQAGLVAALAEAMMKLRQLQKHSE